MKRHKWLPVLPLPRPRCILVCNFVILLMLHYFIQLYHEMHICVVFHHNIILSSLSHAACNCTMHMYHLNMYNAHVSSYMYNDTCTMHMYHHTCTMHMYHLNMYIVQCTCIIIHVQWYMYNAHVSSNQLVSSASWFSVLINLSQVNP